MIAHLVALALHCGHGEMYRVHLHKCVAKTSPLARGFRTHHAKAAEPKYYVNITIHARPDPVITEAEIAAIAPPKPHAWFEADGATPRHALTLMQQSRLWQWLINTGTKP